jgi:hypothetical protein
MSYTDELFGGKDPVTTKKPKYVQPVSPEAYKVEDIDTEWLYENGIQRGVDVGYAALEKIWSIKKSSTLYVLGAPTSGKSEFIFQILINLSKFYGWKHAIFSPETGSPKEIVADLAAKVAGKDYFDTYSNQMSLGERDKALRFLNEHFIILESDERMTLEGFYQAIEEAEGEYGIKFDTTLIDPWNKLKHLKSGRRDDEYLEDALNDVIQNAKQNKRLNIISTHCRDQAPVTSGGITYYPAPTPRDYAGGQVWYRMGFNMIGLWRIPKGMIDQETGEPYPSNAVQFETHKCKPKGIAEPGKDREKEIIFYDVQKHQYYEKNIFLGGKRYATKTREEIKTNEPPQVDL